MSVIEVNPHFPQKPKTIWAVVEIQDTFIEKEKDPKR